MRFKRGDLVRYVAPNYLNRPNVYGWIGQIVRYQRSATGADAWIVDPPLPGGIVLHDGVRRFPEWVSDASLAPIRDPGDDAVDEMTLLAGKPEGVTV